MTKPKYWLSKFFESMLSTLPVALVIVAFFLIFRFASIGSENPAFYSLAISDDEIYIFAIAVGMIIIGMSFFNLGTEESMTEIGKVIGGSLLRKKNFFFVVAMTFILGVLVTIAEPDLSVLSGQIGINSQIITWVIGVGVGIFLVVGVIRVLLHQNLNVMFLAFYGLVFVLGYIIDPRFLPICFDSGGVTTGPVTVPFLLGFGLGLAASHGGKNSEDSFGLTALCSVGPIIAVTCLATIMKFMGKELPMMSEFKDPLASLEGWSGIVPALIKASKDVALSVVPILAFFIIYEVIFIKLKRKVLVRIILGMVFVYLGLVLFLSAVAFGFLPIASKVGQQLGSDSKFFPYATIIGALFGIFGVLAEPAVHVLANQINDVSDGVIKKSKILFVLATANGLAVVLHIIRAYYHFPIMYYLVPGYILAFVLSFIVPKIYTAMAFDSGGVASGPMTSTFVLPFCIGFAYQNYLGNPDKGDVYLYGFGLVALVALMPLIVLQIIGLDAQIKKTVAYNKARKRIVEEDDDQVVHFVVGVDNYGR